MKIADRWKFKDKYDGRHLEDFKKRVLAWLQEIDGRMNDVEDGTTPIPDMMEAVTTNTGEVVFDEAGDVVYIVR